MTNVDPGTEPVPPPDPAPTDPPPAETPPTEAPAPPAEASGEEPFKLAKPGSKDYVAGQPVDEAELAKVTAEHDKLVADAKAKADQAKTAAAAG